MVHVQKAALKTAEQNKLYKNLDRIRANKHSGICELIIHTLYSGVNFKKCRMSDVSEDDNI